MTENPIKKFNLLQSLHKHFLSFLADFKKRKIKERINYVLLASSISLFIFAFIVAFLLFYKINALVPTVATDSLLTQIFSQMETIFNQMYSIIFVASFFAQCLLPLALLDLAILRRVSTSMRTKLIFKMFQKKLLIIFCINIVPSILGILILIAETVGLH